MRRAVNRLAVAVVIAVVVLSAACSAILGDASYRCAADDTGACPPGTVCAVASGMCVDEDGVTDGGGTTDVTTPPSLDAGDASGDDTGADATSPTGDASTDARVDAHDGSEASTFAAAPVCDGVIGAGEYGSTVENTNVVHATSGQPWYATWDDTNLYLAVAGVALDDGVVVYLSSLATGATQGFDNYDEVTIDPLPFPAQLVLYAKAGNVDQEYSEYRTYSAGAWSDATSGTPTVCGTDTGTNARELVLPWTALGVSARPASFRFLLFATESTDFGPFAQVPTTNPAGSTDEWTHAFSVSNTAPGGSPPFAAPY